MFLVFAFAFCGIFLNVNFQSCNEVTADGGNADIWNGKTDSNSFTKDGDTYYIHSAGGLAYFAKTVQGDGSIYTSYSGSTIILETDIDLAGMEWTSITPNASGSFQGTFDGAGHSIYNMKITEAVNGNYGFFGSVENATIKNLHLKNLDIKASSGKVGGIVASGSGEILNCSASGTISGGDYLGGLVGYASGQLSVSKSKSSVTLKDGKKSVGGLVGCASAELNLNVVANTANLSISSGDLGGLVGTMSSGSVNLAYNSGILTGSSVTNIGGLIGNLSDKISITESYNGGDIVAGLDGGNYGGLIGNMASSTEQEISYSFSVGEISRVSKKNKIAGGNSEEVDLSNSVIGYDINSENEYEKNLKKYAKTPEFYINFSSWANPSAPLEVEDILWNIGENDNWNVRTGFNNGYPFLVDLEKLSFDNTWTGNVTSLVGSGTFESPYLVRTAEELAFVAKKYNSQTQTAGQYYMLTSDIDLTGRTWQPIGATKNYAGFNGVFDGNGHTVKGISCSLQENFIYVGLFGKVTNAVIKNLTIGNYLKMNCAEGVKPGSLIGATNGNTYVINCADNSGLDISAIGVKESGTVYTIYGTNTLSNGNIKVDGSVQISGFETFVRGGMAGKTAGFFYQISSGRDSNTIDELIACDYRVLVDVNGEVLRPVNTSGGLIDKSYQTVLMPKGIQLLGKSTSSFLIREDATLSTKSPYKYIGAGGVSCDENFKLLSTPSVKLCAGLEAVWSDDDEVEPDPEEPPVDPTEPLPENIKFKVIYNAYEIDVFNAVTNNSAPYRNQTVDGTSSTIEIVDGQIVVNYDLKFASSLKAQKSLYAIIKNPCFNSKPLRNGFSVDALYYNYSKSSHSFMNPISESSLLISDTVVYAKWKGDVAEKKTVRVDFVSSSKEISASEAIASLHVTKQGKTATTSEVGIVGTTGSFKYSSSLGESKDNWVQFSLELNPGYKLENHMILSSSVFNESRDTNFGVLTTNSVAYFDDVADFNDIKFYNFVADYENSGTGDGTLIITITVSAIIYVDSLDISEDVYLGTSPLQNFVVEKKSGDSGEYYQSNLYVYIEEHWTELFTAVNAITKDQADVLVGASGAKVGVTWGTGSWIFVFSGSTESGLPGFAVDSYQTKSKLYLRFGTSDYFEYEKTGSSVVLRRVDETLELVKTLVTIENNEMKYIAGNSFRTVVAKKQFDEKAISQCGYEMSSFSSATRTMLEGKINIYDARPNLNSAESLYIDFDGIYRTETDAKYYGYLRIITSYTKAAVTFEFKYLNSTTKEFGDFDNERFKPTIVRSLSPESYSIAEDGTVTFVVESSRYYRFYSDLSGTDSVTFGNNAGIGSYNIFVTMQSGELVDDFNRVINSVYFYSTEVTPGQISDGEFIPGRTTIDYLNYSYKISMKFYHEDYGGIEGLRAGTYKVSIVCTDVFYGLNIDSKIIQSESIGLPTEVSREDLVDAPDDAGITTEVENPTIFVNNKRTLKYDTAVQVVTKATTESQNFYGWFFKGDDASEDEVILNNRNVDDKRLVLSQIGARLMPYDRTIIDLYSLYSNKTVILQIDDSAITKDTLNGTESSEYFNGTELSASINNVRSWAYRYGSITPITINITGRKSIAYSLVGFKIFDFEGKQYDEQLGLNPFSTQFLKEGIENGTYASGEDVQVETYLLRPILEIRTVTVNFYSGTGERNQFGDGKNGVVRNVNGDITTENKYTITQTFGTDIHLNIIVPLEEELTVEQLFASRDGYTLPDTYYWACKNGAVEISVYGSDLNLNMDVLTQGFELSFYRNWNNQKFQIIFNSNGGSYSDRTTAKSVDVFYELPFTDVDKVPKSTDLTNLGHELIGWSVIKNETSDFLFTVDGNLNRTSAAFTSNKYFDAVGNYVVNGNLNVYAIWSSAEFVARIMFNGATSLTEKDVDVAEANMEYKDYTVTYGDTFENLKSNSDKIGIEAIKPARNGFNFAGFYILEGINLYSVTNATTFDNSLPTFAFTGDIAVVIYARWTFDTTQFMLEIIDNAQQKEYSGVEQKFYLADYFSIGNYNENGFNISVDDNTFNISIDENLFDNVTLSWTLSSTDVSVEKDSFSMLNVGQCIVTLSVVVTDNAELLNLGTLWTASIDLQGILTLAELNVVRDETNQTYYIYNASRIMKPFVDSEIYEQISKTSELQDFARVIRSLNTGDREIAADATPTQIYEYIMLKYFYLMFNNGSVYRTYKLWTYNDFKEFAQGEGAAEKERLIEALSYFDYFNHENVGKQISTDYGKFFKVVSNVNNVNIEESVKIEEIVIYTKVGIDLYPSQSTIQNLRVYLTANDGVLENYNLAVESETGRRYVEIKDCGFVLPEVLTKTNNIPESEKKSYYSSLYEKREVNFVPNTTGEKVDFDGKTYYKLEQTYQTRALYLYAVLHTSNAGVAEKDSNFAFTTCHSGEKDFEYNDFLYFDTIDIGYLVNDRIQSILGQFRVVLTEEDIYTILGTGDVALLNVGTRSLSSDGYDTVFKTIDGEREQGLLSVESVTYQKEGEEEKTVSGVDIPKSGAYTDLDGVVIFEVVTNDANEISVIVNKNFIKNVKIRANNETIYDGFYGLYKWVSDSIYTIDGTMAMYEKDGTTFTYTKEMIEEEFNNEGLTILNRFAVYTNFVLVTYNLNLQMYDTEEVSMLSLGVSTNIDLRIPSVKGLVCTSLKILRNGKDTGDDAEMLFQGENGVFVGYGDAIFKPITLLATWRLDELDYIQYLDEFIGAVGTFSSLNIDDVVYLLNQNDDLFDYTYAWYKRDISGSGQLVSSDEILTLEEQGSANESGTYYILITATLKEQYRNSLQSPDEFEVSEQVDFTLEFKQNEVYEIIVPDAQEGEFNGQDYLKSPFDDWFNVTVKYYVYSQEHEDYDRNNGEEINLKYITTGSIYFLVYNQAEEEKADEIVNVGSYRIDLKFQDAKFTFMEGVKEENSFYFKVTPHEIALTSDTQISLGKKFNSEEPEELASVYDVRVGDSFLETLSLKFRRDEGEDVGEYNLYLTGIESKRNFMKNYKITFDGEVIFQDGMILAPSESDTPIGIFTITNSGTLRLFYTEVENNVLQKDFVSGGYSVSVAVGEDDKFVLQFSSTAGTFTVEISLYDETQNAVISNEKILDYLRQIVNTIDAKFFMSNKIEPAINSGLYSYVFELDESYADVKNISNYYANVTMAENCRFEILQKKIVLEELFGDNLDKLQKVYDNTLYAQYSITTGEQIEDLEGFSGVYIYATFDTVHAGENIGVNLMLANTEDVAGDGTGEYNLGNYALSSVRGYGKILKRDAQLSLKMEDSYIYGQLSENQLRNEISILSLEDKNGDDVKGSMLVAGYYQLVYSIASFNGVSIKESKDTIYTNDNGNGTFLLKGEYTVLVNVSFEDFNITNATENVLNDYPAFSVTTKEINYMVRDGYISRTLRKAKEFESYAEQYIVAETGDELELIFVLTDDVDEFIAEEYYSISLLNGGEKTFKMDYVSGSISIQLISNSGLERNKGFYVMPAEETLFVKLVMPEDITYDGKFYGFVTENMILDSSQSKKLSLNEVDVAVSFVLMETDGSENEVAENEFVFSKFQIEIVGASEEDAGKVKNAGTYKLKLDASVADKSYGSVLFYDEYKLVIKKKVINVDDLEIKKFYDGRTDVEVNVDESFLAEGDSLTLSGQFSDPNVGDGKTLRFVGMQGNALANYELSASQTTGDIKPAQATITIDGDKLNYIYGDIKHIDDGNAYIGLNFVVYDTSNGTLESNKLPISENLYTLNISLSKTDGEGAIYSALGYLRTGTYTLTVTGAPKISGTVANYEFQSFERQIVVSPYEYQIVYKEDGEITVEYGSSLIQGDKYTYTLTEDKAPLAESLEIVLQRNDSSPEVGYYRIIGVECSNTDYSLSVNDKSVQGAFQIIKMQSSLIYVLFADGTNEATFEYDAKVYDQILIESKDVEAKTKYYLVVKNQATGDKKEFELAFFVKELENYVLYTGEVRDFVATGINFVAQNSSDKFINRVGSYLIYAGTTTSGTNEVRLGKSATETQFAFKLNVAQKKLYFKNEYKTLQEMFTNAPAIFSYSQDILEGIINDEQVGVQVTFLTSGKQPAVYVGEEPYSISAVLTGKDAGNYDISSCTTVDGVEVKGVITKAPVVINLDSDAMVFIYGDEIKPNLTYQFNSELTLFNIQSYMLARRFEIVYTIYGEKSLRSEKYIVGSHDIEIMLESDDFQLVGFIKNGERIELGKITDGLTIVERQLELEELEIPLANIFTKAYDGTTDLKIFADDMERELLFNITNKVENDDVTISNAEFASVSGDSIKINFTLSGDDANNYVEPNMFGRIISIKIHINFVNTESEAEYRLGGRELLSDVSYPLKNLQRLTDNAVSSEQKNEGSFPTQFVPATIPVGKEFLYWTMDFDFSDKGNASELKELLTNLKYQISGFTTIEDENEPNKIKVVVGNDAKTVTFLNLLVGDDSYRELGYSFKDKTGMEDEENKVDVTFTSVWETIKQNLRVYIVDENGDELVSGSGVVENRGTLTVEVPSLEINENNITEFNGKVEYGQSFSVTVSPANHFVLDSFYNGKSYLEAGENVVISGNKLTISNVSKDFTIYVRMRYQKVNVELELPEDATMKDGNFVKKAETEKNIYEWKTSYDNLEKYTLQDLAENIERDGYDIKGFDVNGTEYLFEVGGQEMDENLNKTLGELLSDLEDDAELTIKPVYDIITYTITYYTNEGVWVDEESVPKSYTTDKGVILPGEDSITKEGYTFGGWFTDFEFKEETLKAEIGIGEVGNISLYAKWNIIKSNIEITYQNLSISDVNFVLDEEPLGNLFVESEEGGKVVATDISYGTKVTFRMLVSEDFYHLDLEIWKTLETKYGEGFDVTFLNEAKSYVEISLTMPAENVSFEVIADYIKFKVSYNTELLSVVATDMTDDNQLAEISGSVDIIKGHKLKLVVTPDSGYEITNEIDFVGQTSGLTVSKVVENNVLTVEIEGISEDLAITFHINELPVEITLRFSDNKAVNSVKINEKTYFGEGLSALPKISAIAGSDFSTSIFVKYNFGYEFSTVSPTNCSAEKINVDKDGWVEILISGILKSGEVLISSKYVKFNISLVAVTFDSVGEEQVANNKAYFGTNTNLTKQEIDFLSDVTLTATNGEEGYDFAGWSLSRQSGHYISNAKSYSCTLTEELLTSASYDVESSSYIIYAIFTTKTVNINLDARLYYKLFEEYEADEPEKVEEVYSTMPALNFTNARGEKITSVAYNFGLDLNFNVEIPDGYLYRGYGYYKTEGDAQEFVLLGGETTSGSQISVEIKNGEFGVGVNTIYVVLIPRATQIQVNTIIEVEGFRELDLDVGKVQLTNNEGETVNKYGYVEGTLVHYEEYPTDNTKQFSIIAYTSSKVFIKVETERAGYTIDRVEAILSMQQEGVENPEVSKILEAADYSIFCIDKLIGGKYVYVTVVFKPLLNIIDLDFYNNGDKAEGGAFEVIPLLGNEHKVWTSGSDYSALSVLAYTDSHFDIVAYVRAGFTVDFNQVKGELKEYSIVDKNSIEYHELSIEETGYVGKVTFRINGGVEEFLGRNHIVITLGSSKYTVVFKNGDKTLARVENVSFNESINLSRLNSNNIHEDPSIKYVNGRLNLVQRKSGYVFMGYFTSQNGGGKQYIDYNGDVVGKWLENGYVYNKVTNLFEYSENLEIDDEGNFEISVYQYQSYQKTRINISIVPSESLNYTAQEIISGVDYTNSWYYEASPHYMEVSYNTDIYFTAPKINGYQFYKFVIKQRNGNGDWVADVESFAENLPWSTNNKDNYVECQVQIIYFAQVDIRIVGGEVEEIAIEQEPVTDSQGKTLLKKGFVMTGEKFTLTAKLKQGYTFLNWNILSDGGVTSLDNPLQMRAIVRRASLVLNLEGDKVTLGFNDYDTKFGQIREMYSQVINGENYSYVLGSGTGLAFVKERIRVDVRVGCDVTFALTVDEGYSVNWGERKDVSYLGYDKNINRHLFSLKITAEHANETNNAHEKVVEIVPIFENTSFAIYITNSFVDKDIIQDALDGNDVNVAGGALFNGEMTKFFSVSNKGQVAFDTVCNERYAISSVTISNMGQNFTDMSQFFTEDGKIILTREFIQANGIQGTIYVHIQFTRLLWENEFNDEEEILFKGEGTYKNPYKISSEKELAQMMALCNKGMSNSNEVKYNECYWVVVNDIDLGEEFWTPIGTREQFFNGYFNFNDHSISGIGLAMEYNPIRYNGLFGVIGSKATIILGKTSYWYLWLILIILLLLILIIVVLIVVNRKKKKEREKLSKQ